MLDHEAPLPVGFALVAVGLALLLFGERRAARPTSLPRARFVLLLGLACVAGVLAYNALRGSTISAPELAILGYGAALAWASRDLARYGRAVAYSFPLALAPLSLYALNAALVSGVGATPLALYIEHGLVAPMAAALSGVGIDVAISGETLRLSTERGALFLTVGVVCAGLFAMVLFLGIFALFAWESRTRGWRLAAYLALGLLGLHVANVLRLVLLGLVGHRWGGDALQAFHRHAGWVLFLAWGILFWWLVLRRFERPASVAEAVS